MTLDQRDYMRERARALVERDYYQQTKTSHGTHWSIILALWMTIALGLWLLFEAFA